jgi:copper chaperone CopZ
MAQTLELSITGMTCDHCVHSVTEAAKSTAGVTSATVSLDDKSATVTGENVDVKALIAAIEEEGYEASVK